MAGEDVVSRIDELFEPFAFATAATPGANVAVVRDGALEFVRSYGMASIEHSVPITRDTVFYIASTSKQFVGASIAILEAEGKLSLDDDIREWLPELHAFEPLVRIHHLLHHTSGIRDKYSLAAIGGLSEDSYSTDRGTMELLTAQRTLGSPSGDRMSYSNSGYFLLGQIVERASGVPLHEFAVNRIFDPLGMTRTCFRPDTDVVIPHRASGYRQTEDGAWLLAEYTLSSLGPGGVVTTIDDLATWDASFGRDLLDPPGLHARMLRTRPLNDGSTNTYGYGLISDEWRGLRAVHHGGGVSGFTAEFLRFPDEKLTIICLANSPAVNALTKARQVAEIVLGARLTAVSEPPTPSTDGVTVPERRGSYVARDDSFIAAITESDEGGDVLRISGQRIALSRAGERTLVAGPLVLEFDETGGFTLAQTGMTIATFDRLDESEAGSADLVGSYRSAELSSTATVARLDDGSLTIERPRSGAIGLVPIAGDLYMTDGRTMSQQVAIVVRGVRGADGTVTSLVLSMSRAPHNVFERIE